MNIIKCVKINLKKLIKILYIWEKTNYLLKNIKFKLKNNTKLYIRLFENFF